jgi:hypothetical protein
MSDDLWASRLLMSQWPNSTGAHRISEETRFSISPATASTSGASKKAERAFMQLAHFSQPNTRADVLNHGSTAYDRNEEGDPGSQRVLEEQDKEGDTVCASLGDLDKKRDVVSVAL